jgi:hypothetical protein
MKTNLEIAAALRGFYTQQIVSLNGIMEDLPEPFKGQLLTMKAEINGLLDKLPLTDAVPAAQEANWGITYMAGALNHLKEMMERMNTVITGLKAKVADMPALVQNGVTERINEQVTAGDLFKKETVTTLVNAAKQEATKEANKNLGTVSQRSTVLLGKNLPMPVTEILLADDAAFTAALAQAETRRTKLAELNIVLNGETAELNDLLYCEPARFDSELKKFSLVLNGAKPPKAKPADPLRTAGGDTAGGASALPCV